MKVYPICLIGLKGRRAVVVGGGAVAARKVAGLLEADARVTVISPILAPELESLVAAGRITPVKRPYRPGDLDGAFLVIAATDDATVNQAVWQEAERRRCLVNVVDDPTHSNFIMPAVVRRGEVTIAISTGGASPALARRLRERLEALIGPEYGELARLLAELRPELRAHHPEERARREAAFRLVDADLLEVISREGVDQARKRARKLLAGEEETPPGQQQGIVYLVGAGPGDPGLITLRGIECLKRAEVVVYDRLVNRSLLTYARHAELIDVGKQPDRHTVAQDEINALLIARARAGQVVVRLKGGDPFVFGRGGEEALALAEAGLPFEIVPGVTSAIAAPAYAGIPVTHRGMARSVAFATGHRADFVEDPACDWGRLGGGPDTLVFLMGVRNLPRIVEQLLTNGRSPDTPVALVERGTRTNQKTVVGTLANIVERAAEVRPPAAVVVGDVVRLRQSLRWFDLPHRRPLLGLRVLNTRPSPQAGGLTRRLTALGAEAVELPTTQVAPVADSAPLDAAINQLAHSDPHTPVWDWLIFTSVNSVSFFFRRLLALGHDVRALAGVKLGAVGRATARALLDYGLVADFIPTRYTGQDIAAEIGDVTGQRVLLPRSETAPATLVTALNDRGALVDTVTAYTVRPAKPDPIALATLLDGDLDVATFTSSSGLTGLATMLNGRSVAEVLSPLTVVCIGPTTADAARALGVRVDLVAKEHTVEGMVKALVEWYGRR